MRLEPRRSHAKYLLPPLAYLLVAVSGPVYYLFAMQQSTDGNIGAGIALMWTALWGLPWSIWPWMTSSALGFELGVIFFSCALVNVALVGMMMWRRWRRETGTSTASHHATAP
jgi:hypothetical protein